MKRPYRSVEFNDERKWKSKQDHDDVLQVGIQKAVGYTIFDTNDKESLMSLHESMARQGKFVFIKEEKDYDFNVLWTGDKTMMQPILDKKKELLTQAECPHDAENFFKMICHDHVDHDENEELYHLICDLFNSWCLWCESPVRGPDRGVLLSKYPYDPDLDNG